MIIAWAYIIGPYQPAARSQMLTSTRIEQIFYLLLSACVCVSEWVNKHNLFLLTKEQK